MPRRVHALYWSVFLYAAVGALGRSPLHATAAALWLCAGSAAWIAATVLDLRLRDVEARHDASPLPQVAGWRLVAALPEVDPHLLLALDALCFLYDHVEVRWQRTPGAASPGGRWTYAEGIRQTLRAWARSRGLPVRAGDRMGRRLVELGAIALVRRSQAVAWTLPNEDLASAIRALESNSGRALVDWSLPRDHRVPTSHRRAVSEPR